jgi:hypothetical protein
MMYGTSWPGGAENKIFFAPEKLEMQIHLTKKSGNHAPQCIVNDELTIDPITTGLKPGEQPALRWLGVWFDRKLYYLSDMSPNRQPKPGESLTISGVLLEPRMVHQLPLSVKQLSPVFYPRYCTVQKQGMQDAQSQHVRNVP